MDVIEASNMEVIKQYLNDNEGHEFKAMKTQGYWVLWVGETYPRFQMTAPTFGEAAKLLSKAIYTFNNPGVENERSNRKS